jgi:hypothetical protein
MRQYLIKISLTLVLVFSFATPIYASPIRSDDMAGHHNNDNDVTLTEPDIVFDGMQADRHHHNNRKAIRNMYGRYDQVPELPYGNGQIPPAPVPEPLTLVLFGMGMIGVGFLARRRTI